jgi:hypothetical protein
MRAHIVVPDELIAEVDAQVGQRKRSRFIVEAIEEKLRNISALEAFDAVAGSLVGVDIPGWETPESATEWVRAMRRESDRVDALWGDARYDRAETEDADRSGAE